MNPLDNLLLTYELIRTILYFSLLRVSVIRVNKELFSQEFYDKLRSVHDSLSFRKKNSTQFLEAELDAELQKI